MVVTRARRCAGPILPGVARAMPGRRSPVDAVLRRPAAAVVVGFAVAVVVGTVVLMLPVATADGAAAGWVTFLFTMRPAASFTRFAEAAPSTCWSPMACP